ncbi:hypothetical protein PCC7418_2074 [Halothece sp. PCC 7418]|uniref:DUF7305 domain-containing protein n=1 Tax=Halothece sp. (strain PCC 7418) TaxID=65093 RepID=UPI0002A082A5|nr:hypothetical protein [Halothece sp. PCC 7418]AFZ44237.1 hypothetical protein PCC7418_2074 [Halothece sp. PCC 7418]
MNKISLKNLPCQLQLKILREYKINQQKGFSLPLIMGLGLIMMVVVLTLLGRSQKDQVVTALEEGSAQSLSVAEAGVSDTLSLISTVKTIADVDLPDWSDEATKLNNALCSDDGSTPLVARLNDYAGGVWISVNDGRDRYRIDNYTYDAVNEEGRLQITGQANIASKTSTSVLEVVIPVTTIISDDDGFAPGLLANQVDVKNETIDGSVAVSGCQEDSDISSEEESQITGELTYNPLIEFPDIPTPPVTPYDLGAITSATTLPLNLPSESPAIVHDETSSHYDSATDTYYYQADYIYMSGSDLLEIENGKNVALYVQGRTGKDVDFKGSSGLVNNNANPTSFSLYGATSDVDQMCLSGNNLLEAFVLAPDANVGVNGSGGSLKFAGALWIDKWRWDGVCSSNPSGTLIAQDVTWSEIPTSLRAEIDGFEKVNPLASWQRNAQ